MCSCTCGRCLNVEVEIRNIVVEASTAGGQGSVGAIDDRLARVSGLIGSII